MKTEDAYLNIPSVTVGNLVGMLSAFYANAIKKAALLKEVPAVILWGSPGIGKSQAIKQIAQKIEGNTGKKVVVTDVRLLLFNPIDLRGMPTVNEDKTLSVWLKPKIFEMDESDDVINILFLDELSAAPATLQAAAYQICLDRQVGEHKLPQNCIVLAAGNRTTDKSVSFKMPKALCNRLMHFNVTTNYKIWLQWALANGIDSRIIGYLAFAESKLCIDPESSDMAYSTPRSWEMVNNILKFTDGDIESSRTLIAACVGMDTALEFETWAKTHDKLPTVEEVLSGRKVKYPPTSDALLAFMASIVSAIRSNKEDISVAELENACAYINKIPIDFATMFYGDLNSIKEVGLKLMKCPAYHAWVSKNKNRI